MAVDLEEELGKEGASKAHRARVLCMRYVSALLAAGDARRMAKARDVTEAKAEGFSICNYCQEPARDLQEDTAPERVCPCGLENFFSPVPKVLVKKRQLECEGFASLEAIEMALKAVNALKGNDDGHEGKKSETGRCCSVD